jgi:hypothetical protein
VLGSSLFFCGRRNTVQSHEFDRRRNFLWIIAPPVMSRASRVLRIQFLTSWDGIGPAPSHCEGGTPDELFIRADLDTVLTLRDEKGVPVWSRLPRPIT